MLMAAAVSAAQAEEVTVGLAPFPPFIETRGQALSGMAVDMMAAMNKAQDKYVFQGKLTSARRRHDEFDQGKFDLSIFDHYRWGWKGRPVDVSDAYYHGGERYVALRAEGRSQAFFGDFENRTMIGISGYHYGFAGFNADEGYLRQKYNMQLPGDPEVLLKMLMARRGDIAVVTEVYLNMYLLNNPQDREKLLVSEIYDQEYAFSMIVRQGIGLNVAELNKLIADMEQSGALREVWNKYGYTKRQ